MLCSIIKAEKFLKNYPQCKGVIYNIINNHQKMNMLGENKAGEDKTEMLVEKYKKNYDYDTANFKNPLLPGFKHKLELLNESCPDRKVLKNSLIGTNSEEEKWFWPKLKLIDECEPVKIYRVVPSDETAEAESGARESSKKVLMLHGTSAKGVEAILKAGIKSPPTWSLNYLRYGAGVFHSNCIRAEYENKLYEEDSFHALDQGVVKKLSYFFVNEITVPTDGYSLFEGGSGDGMSHKDYLKNEPGLKVFEDHQGHKMPRDFEDCPNSKVDGEGRKILNGTFHRDVWRNAAVAHHDLVEPAYLLEIAEKPAVDEVADDFGFARDEERFAGRDNESFTKELGKQIADWKLEHVRSDHWYMEDEVHRAVEQLSFNLNSLSEPKDGSDAKYRTELVRERDDDYQFISSLVEKRGTRKNMKLRHVFRVDPVDESERLNLKNKYVFYRGVKSNEVGEILANGYKPRDDASEDTRFEIYRDDLHPPDSYCMDGRVPRKLSFAFVYTSGVDCEELRLEDSEFLKDSRGVCVDVGGPDDDTLGNSHRRVKPVCGRTPVYLVVCKC